MDLSFIRLRPPLVLVLALVAGGLSSCGKRKASSSATRGVLSQSLNENRLSAEPGPVYRSQEKSAIRWQPWNKDTVKAARDAKRLILLVVAMPQQSIFKDILSRLEQDGNLVRSIHANYVPVLVDGDAVREMGLFAAPLCAEIKQSLDLPLFIWMTDELNPVAWMPISNNRTDEASRIFNQSHEMVSRMWRDDPEYVMRNSRMDNDSRRSRMQAENRAVTASSDPARDARGAARQLISLYDPFSRTIDETGGLFPSGVMDVITATASLPGISGGLREKGLEMTEDLLEDLLPSAMFDPLEGGVFSGRMAQSWALPSFTWNCPDQGRAAALLFRSHQITGDPTALERALGLLKFSEGRFKTEDGLFAFGTIGGGTPAQWLWKTEEIEKELPAEDAKWWIAATGMKTLGNLPSEIDPGRAFFRMNSIALPRPLPAVAAKLGVPADQFAASFERSRLKLLEVRRAKLKEDGADLLPHAAANFRMISAYAAAYTATGESAYREKASDLLKRSRDTFEVGGRLQVFRSGINSPSIEGRAFLYALAVQASIDVADITSDESGLTWASELCDTAEKLFLSDGHLMEVSADARMIDLPIMDSRRIFDDTSGGLFALSEARLAPSGHPVAASLRRLAATLPGNAPQTPILHTDVVLATLVKLKSKSVIYGKGLSPEMKTVVERLPLQLIPRGPAKVSDGIPDGSVRVIAADGSAKLISDPSVLKKEILLSDQAP